MKSITRFIVIILTTCLLSNLIGVNKTSAQPVNADQAKLVAKNFFADRLSRSRISTIKGISYQNLEMALVHEEKGDLSNSIDQKKGLQALPVYYIFNVKDKTNPKDKSGFIIISADQRVPAVLGYSFNEEFSGDDQAPAFKDWMDHYKEQIIYIIQNNLSPDLEISENWKKYSSTTESKGTKQLSEVTPMLKTEWSQRSYHNNLCPADARCTGSWNGHVPAGCVSVAMAQIMKKYGYPTTNNPIPGYTDDSDAGSPITYPAYVIPGIGVTTYDWEHMPNDINKALYPDPPTSGQMVGIEAVSTLIYHCGVAVQMDYSPVGSGAGSPFNSDVENAFKNYFNYSQDIHKIFRSDNDSIQWESALKNELDNGRPVYYSGYQNDDYDGGHAFVCDGYQDRDPDNKPYFNFNFGFGGGGGDGYYYIGWLRTSASHDFRFKQWAIIGISPAASQQNCTIKGYVRDGESGSPLPAINILIKGTIIGGTTNSTGNYYISNIPAGVVTVVASLPGYSGSSKTLVTEGGKIYTVNFWSNAVSDADGNSYGAVEIGPQTWMAENLKTTKYSDGTGIPLVTNNPLWPTLTIPGYGWYDNEIANKDIYGALYNWYTVQSGKLCPTGWHVPTDGDWTILSDYLGGPHAAGGKLKEPGTVHWKDPNIGATNDYGFTALPGGYRYPTVGEFGGNFYNIKGLGFWWSSTEASTTNAFVRIMGWDNTSVSPQTASSLTTGCSVRCLKGPLVVTIPGESGAFAYGDIGIEGEEDWYKFFTGATGDYAIQTYGNTDTYMYLYDSDQTTVIAENNDGAKSGNSKIVQNLSANMWYYIKVRGNGNSTGSYSIGFSALPAAPIDHNLTVTYDGLSHTASASGPSGVSIVWYDAATGGNVTTQPVGTNYGSYSAYAEAVNDVTGCTSVLRTKVTLTIDQRLATWTTNTNRKTYGDADPSPLTTGSGSNFIVADGVTASYNRASGKTAGDYHINATLSPVGALTNYNISNTGAVFTIDRKVASVKPTASGKYCGQADPVFSGILTGFLPGDEVSAIYSRTAGETVEGSPYTISASLLPVNVLDNYNIAYSSATLTILSVSIDASQSSIPVPVGTPIVILSAKVSDASANSIPGVEVWFSVENGNNQITSYPSVSTDGSGIANLTLNELATMVDVLKVTAVAGQGCGSASTSVAYLAVYDPTGGFVTGGGWINSPAGAYRADPLLTGKANFGFVSKYKKGSNIPDGNTEFQFHEGNLNFSSSSYDLGSLVITGYKAIYKGSGTINGNGNYKFMVSAVDGNVSGGGGYDKFRIKIWNKTDNTIVYDNNLGKDENDIPATVLGGGSIVIHKSKESNTKSNQTTEFGLKVYPNPFTDRIFFELQLPYDSKVRIEIRDIRGTLRKTMNDMVVGYDLYRFEYVPEDSNKGIFFYRIIINGQEMFTGKLIHN
jgi:uncharacterized protein (TIGR02145 family)